jgi:hypothetical protein
MEMEISPAHPKNVLWVVGLYDEFRSVAAMRRCMAESAGVDSGEGVTVGSFSEGTARRLAVSPTADHFTELQDPGVQRVVIDWFVNALGLEPPHGRLWVTRARSIYFLGWTLLLGGCLARLRVAGARKKSAARALPAVALVLTLALGAVAETPFTLAADVMLFLIYHGLFGAYILLADGKWLRRMARFFVRFTVVLWISICLTLLLNSLPAISEKPMYLLSFPEFVLFYPISMLYNYLFLHARQFLFTPLDLHFMQVVPSLGVFVFLAIEIIRPGWIIGLAVSIPDRLRVRATVDGGKMKDSRSALAALGVLLVVLGITSWTRFQQGFLTGESTFAALVFVVRYGILGTVVFLMIWRFLRWNVPLAKERKQA